MSNPTALRPSSRIGLDRDRSATRGVLIMLIVLGHNRLFHDSYYFLYVALYSFHVAAFLLLPFLYAPKRLRAATLVDLFLRYMVPFYATVIVYSLAYLTIEVGFSDTGTSTWAAKLLGALTLANAYFVKQATGFEMLWFLPAFAVLVYFYMAFTEATGALRWVLIGGAVAAHGLVGLLPAEALRWIPFSAYISLYVLLPGLVLTALRDRIENLRASQFVLAGVVLLVACMMQYRANAVIILSEFRVFSWRTPYELLLTDIQMLSGTLVCVGIGRWLRNVALLTSPGNQSMKSTWRTASSATPSTRPMGAWGMACLRRWRSASPSPPPWRSAMRSRLSWAGSTCSAGCFRGVSTTSDRGEVARRAKSSVRLFLARMMVRIAYPVDNWQIVKGTA